MTSLEQTFLHFPGVGPRTERRLWDAGVDDWKSLKATLMKSAIGPRGPFIPSPVTTDRLDKALPPL